MHKLSTGLLCLLLILLALALPAAADGERTVAQSSDITIAVSDTQAVFSLTVADLPETFVFNRKESDDNSMEYQFELSFYDGQTVYAVASSHFKFGGGGETVPFSRMQHDLWRYNQDDYGASSLSSLEAEIDGHTITWTLPLPAMDRDGIPVEIDFDNIQAVGSLVHDSAASKNTVHAYLLDGDGSLRNIGDLSLAQMVRAGDIQALVAEAAPAGANAAEVARIPEGYTVVIQSPEMTIAVGGEEAFFSLTVEDLPETFAVNRPETTEYHMEYMYSLYLYDGRALYEVASSHSKIGDTEETIDFSQMTHTLSTHEMGMPGWSGSAEIAARLEDNKIVWTFPLPIADYEGNTVSIDFENIQAVGAVFHNTAEGLMEGDTYLVRGDGSLQHVKDLEPAPYFRSGELQALIAEGAAGADGAPSVAAVPEGYTTLVQTPEMTIAVSEAEAVFSLTLEDLPETFAYNRNRGMEYKYSLYFYDGQTQGATVYEVASTHFHQGEDEETAGFSGMQHQFMLSDLSTILSNEITPIQAQASGNTITWTLPLPITDNEGNTVAIDFSNIRAVGYDVFNFPENVFAHKAYLADADGAFVQGDIRAFLAKAAQDDARLAAVPEGYTTIVQSPEMTIAVGGEEALFSLTVEDLPETFLFNRKENPVRESEYFYSLSFYDGQSVYEVSSSHFKSDVDEEAGDFSQMQHTLWVNNLEEMSLSDLTSLEARAIGNTITWTLPLPARDLEGNNINIDFTNIQAVGFSVYDIASNLEIAYAYALAGDGNPRLLSDERLANAVQANELESFNAAEAAGSAPAPSAHSSGSPAARTGMAVSSGATLSITEEEASLSMKAEGLADIIADGGADCSLGMTLFDANGRELCVVQSVSRPDAAKRLQMLTSLILHGHKSAQADVAVQLGFGGETVTWSFPLPVPNVVRYTSEQTLYFGDIRYIATYAHSDARAVSMDNVYALENGNVTALDEDARLALAAEGLHLAHNATSAALPKTAAEEAPPPQASAVIAQSPDITITLGETEAVFSLTVEDLPDTFTFNLPHINDRTLEYCYRLFFTDGETVYDIGSSEYKRESEEKAGDFSQMQHRLMLHNAREQTASPVTDVAVQRNGNTITWTLPLDIMDRDGNPVYIDLTKLTAVGSQIVFGGESNVNESETFLVEGGGALQSVSDRKLTDLVRNGELQTLIAAGTGGGDDSASAASVPDAYTSIVSSPEITIALSETEAVFSLTVEEIPGTFAFTDLEYLDFVQLYFYDGQALYNIWSHPAESDGTAATAGFPQMRTATLWLMNPEDSSGKRLTPTSLTSKVDQHSITWTLSLPVKNQDGILVDIDFEHLQAVNSQISISSEGTGEVILHSYLVGADGSLQNIGDEFLTEMIRTGEMEALAETSRPKDTLLLPYNPGMGDYAQALTVGEGGSAREPSASSYEITAVDDTLPGFLRCTVQLARFPQTHYTAKFPYGTSMVTSPDEDYTQSLVARIEPDFGASFPIYAVGNETDGFVGIYGQLERSLDLTSPLYLLLPQDAESFTPDVTIRTDEGRTAIPMSSVSPALLQMPQRAEPLVWLYGGQKPSVTVTFMTYAEYADMHSPLVEATPTPAPPKPSIRFTVTQSGVNIRSGPGTQYTIIGRASADDTFDLTLTGPSDDWYGFVMDDGQDAYISAQFAEIVTED